VHAAGVKRLGLRRRGSIGRRPGTIGSENSGDGNCRQQKNERSDF
jgi:hypothetical protein